MDWFSTRASSVAGLALFIDTFTRASLVVCAVARTVSCSGRQNFDLVQKHVVDQKY